MHERLDLNAVEEGILNICGVLPLPAYKESFVVTMVDKYWAVKEVITLA